MKTYKKRFLALFTALILGTQQSFAMGIPTIDSSALTQAIMQYTQMAKDYAQQLKQYQEMITQNLNIQKQMKEMGIDMEEIGQVLGETKALVNDAMKMYENFKRIPQDLIQETKDVMDACSFMESEIKGFADKIEEAGTKVQNKVNACTLALKTDFGFSERISELENLAIEQEKIAAKIGISLSEKEKAQEKAEEYRHQAKMLANAKQTVIDTTNEQATHVVLNTYDNYLEGDKDNPYSKKRLDEDLKVFSKELNQVKNQKQAQALTNTLLFKLLEMNQRQYEINMNFQAMQAKKEATAQSREKEQREYASSQVVYTEKLSQTFKEEIEAAKDLPYDDTGTIDFVKLLKENSK